jgi:hypothetical protein
MPSAKLGRGRIELDMRIDDSWINMFPLHRDRFDTWRDIEGADAGDFSILDQDRSVVQRFPGSDRDGRAG